MKLEGSPKYLGAHSQPTHKRYDCLGGRSITIECFMQTARFSGNAPGLREKRARASIAICDLWARLLATKALRATELTRRA
jgi:hypothetical protein